ncbi:MAG TPA: metal-dependent hydrolase [Candidatus Limnocylindria bacterium]|nr:metal-dependent hydrolase [Candidatus Limnocylindria bacterium]
MPALGRGFALTWLGHNTFKLVTRSGKTILMDPWVEGNPACPKECRTFDHIDVITISHGHGDHMADAVTLGKKFKPVIVCNYEIHLFLQKKGVSGTSPMNKGGSQEAAGIRFTMVHAVHSSGIEDSGQVVYGGEPCGFVVTLEDGTRLYHAGDTAVHSDMALIAELYAPEIALLPIGDLFTMSPREAALAARLLKPKIVVPAHYGTMPALTGTPEALREELKKLGVGCEVVALAPGESLT